LAYLLHDVTVAIPRGKNPSCRRLRQDPQPGPVRQRSSLDELAAIIAPKNGGCDAVLMENLIGGLCGVSADQLRNRQAGFGEPDCSIR